MSLKKIIVFAIVVVCSSVYAAAEEPYYFKTKIKDGDGALILLERYALNSYQCNFDLFYKLNKIKSGDQLLKHKEYTLPIKIYNFDGKSIRTTLQVERNKADRIQKYNVFLKETGLRSKSYADSKLLWVPQHEINCDAEEVEKTESRSVSIKSDIKLKEYDLFGDKYKTFEVVDKKLSDQVFYLSSGHGGPDPGAVCIDCVQTMCEDEYAYDVALRVARNLMQHGAIVHMVIQDKNDGIRDELYLDCDNDEVTNSGKKLPVRQLDRLKQRADIINYFYEKHKSQGVKSQKAVMIHVDSRGKDKNQDVFFYYYNENKGGKELVQNVHKTFENKYKYYRKDKEYKGYVEDRGLFMLRKVIPSSVYIELANIQNTYDHKRLIHHYNRQALANWIFEGITGIVADVE
jgi:N-acetylmuramoyl-L-alanine amidase